MSFSLVQHDSWLIVHHLEENYGMALGNCHATLPKTHSLQLKMDGLGDDPFILGLGPFSWQTVLVSGRVGHLYAMSLGSCMSKH